MSPFFCLGLTLECDNRSTDGDGCEICLSVHRRPDAFLLHDGVVSGAQIQSKLDDTDG